MSRSLNLRAVSHRRATRLRVGPARVSAIVLLGAMSTVITAFGLPMGAASAASAPRALAPRTSTFCSYAENASKSTSISPKAVTPASIQASFTKRPRE